MADSAHYAAQADPEYGPVFAVLTPQANTTVEPEMHLLLPGSVLTARSTSASPDSRQRLLDYFDSLGDTLAQFDTAPVRAAGFACTGSAYLVGQAVEEARLSELQAAKGFAVVSATQAIRQALQALGAKRIALVSPYPDWLTHAALAYWSAAGHEVLRVLELTTQMQDTRSIYALTSARAAEALAGLDTEGCDVVLLSGTGMPTLACVGVGVEAGAVPVLSSNLCLAWAMQAAVNPAMNSREGLLAFIGVGAAWRKRLAARQERR